MISQMMRWLMVVLVPLIFAGCAVDSTPAVSGELGRKFANTIPGTWTGTLSRDGVECRMYKQFNTDGTASGVLLVKKKMTGVNVVMPEIPFTSRWRVNGDVVETYSVKAGIPGLFKPGQVIRDTVISVSQNRIVAKANDSGQVQVLTRVSSMR